MKKMLLLLLVAGDVFDIYNPSAEAEKLLFDCPRLSDGGVWEEKLDKVIRVLEKLQDRNRMVGVISHVRERLPRYLEVVLVGEDGSRSRIVL